MFDKHLRSRVEPRLAPVGDNLRRTGLTADHLTAFGIVMAAAAAVAIGAGALRLGFLFGVLTAVPDVLDGAVAKASGTTSRRGSFFDSVADRFTDALLFGGVAWYLSTTHTGPIVVLPLAVLGLSMLISYERAKAEALGFHARGGLMERAERLIALGVGVLFETLLIPILWLMLVLTAFTAVQRFVVVWRQASEEVPERPRPVRTRLQARRSRRTSRRIDRAAWRTYRERWADRRERLTGGRGTRRRPGAGA
ncbi:MAG: CDP-alcohol phosphatidyltransferase family protein [Acidimicrobiales bacterium]